MATFKSNLAKKKTLQRALYDGQEYSVTGIIKLPSGTVLTAADTLEFVPVGENQVIHKIGVMGLGTDLVTADFFVGRTQILDSHGNPKTVERRGPNGEAGTKFTSPATDTDRYISTETVAAGYVEEEPELIEKTLGPTMVSLTVGTGDTLTADAEIHVTVWLKGEHNTDAVNAEYLQSYADNGYLIALAAPAE